MNTEKEKILLEIKDFFIKELNYFNEETRKKVLEKTNTIEQIFEDKITNEVKTFKKDVLLSELENVKTNFKNETETIYSNSLTTLEDSIKVLEEKLDDYISMKTDDVESKTSLSIRQMHNVENSILEQIQNLLSYSIQAINSAEKTSLFNLGKYKEELTNSFSEIRNTFERQVQEDKDRVKNELEVEKENTLNRLNSFLTNAKLVLNESKDELIARFDSFIDGAKITLTNHSKQLEGELEAKKNLLMTSIDFDKQTVLNELSKRKDTFLKEINQTGFNERLKLENKANLIFQEVTLALTGYDLEFEEFKTNKLNEFTQQILFIFNEYKKSAKLISENLTTNFNDNFNDKTQTMQNKYLEHLQNLLNATSLHLDSLRNKRNDIVTELGDNASSGLWNRIKTDITNHTNSKLTELTNKTDDSKNQVETLVTARKQDINNLKDEVSSIIGTSDTHLHNGQASVRKSAIDSINFTKDNVLDVLELKRTSSLKDLSDKQASATVEIINDATQNVQNYIASIKPQTYYYLLPIGQNSITLPLYFFTREEMIVTVDGQVLVKDKHYTYEADTKTIKLKKTFNMPVEVFVFEQFPVGKGIVADFTWNGTQLGIKKPEETTYQYTDMATLIPNIAVDLTNVPSLVKSIRHIDGPKFEVSFGENQKVEVEIPTIVGPQGSQGPKGNDGRTPNISLSNGQLLVDGTPTGTSLIGPQGIQGPAGHSPVVGVNASTFKLTVDGNDVGPSLKGNDGVSPVVSLDSEGYLLINGSRVGNSLKGPKGEDGIAGLPGTNGLTPVITMDSQGNIFSDGQQINQKSLVGPAGPAGINGVGIKNITTEQGILKIELTNNEVKNIDLNVLSNNLEVVSLNSSGEFTKTYSNAYELSDGGNNKILRKINAGKLGEVITIRFNNTYSIEHNENIILRNNQSFIQIEDPEIIMQNVQTMTFLCIEGGVNCKWLEIARNWDTLVPHRHNEYANTNVSVTFKQNLTVQGEILCNGEITAFSDARLKTDIRKIENSLDILKKLNGYYFTMNNKKSLGVIAQEVKEVLPEAVRTTDSGGTEYYTVNYSNMVGFLIEVNKELLKRIEKLEGEKWSNLANLDF